MLEAAAAHGKAVWVLDRPNPAGRPVEGTLLREGWESFVGAGPMPMRHGMTMGELGHWFIATLGLELDYQVITMEGWSPDAAPGFGWPTERSWVNPSPNAANLSMARAYAGTVMLEGTTLSEGRGTTRPLELFGAPDIDPVRLLADMRRIAPDWLAGCVLRPCFFEPTFHKHAGQLCAGIQIHVEDPTHYDHGVFQPWRLQALAFKALRMQAPNYPLWRDFAVRIRARSPRDRPHQRWASAARVGGRPGVNARRTGRDRHGRRSRLGSGASPTCSTDQRRSRGQDARGTGSAGPHASLLRR